MAEFFTILISAITVIGFVLVIAAFAAMGRSN